MSGFFTDLKRAFRTLLKTPGFTIAALIVLALGIGANTSIFSIVNGVLLRPLPYEQPDRLVQLWHTPPQQQFPGMTEFSLSAANYLDWERQNDVFEKSAIYTGKSFRFTGGSEPKQFQAAKVEPSFFSVLGVKPLLGRTIGAGDDQPGHENVVVLSYKLWQTEFGGDRSLVGKDIQLNGQAYTVIGVMSRDYDKPQWALLWTPLVWDPAEKAVRGEHHFLAIARLKPGVTVEKAQANLDTISARLAQEYPADDAGWGAKVVPLREETVGEVRKPLFILLGAVAFVLLIACANVANLLLARTLDRRKEIAIRTALGASRARIIRNVLTEATVLSLAGGALGLLVARSGTELVIKFLGSSLPRLNEIRLDAGVLAFTFLIAVLTGTLAGLWPAWRMSKADPQEALKQGGRTDAATGGKRTRQVLVTVEVALSLVLLVGAGLMVRTLWNLRNVNPGFEAQHVLTMDVLVSSTDYKTPQQWKSFFDEVLRRVRPLPGVKAAGFTDSLPLQGGSNQPVAIEGAPVVDMAHQPEVSVRIVTPGFMEAMHIPLVRGRLFADSDTATSPEVVIVSAAMAKQFWPNEDPIGKRLALTFVSDRMRKVVGVVSDVKDNGLNAKEAVSTLYYPVSQVQPPAPLWGGKFGSFPLQLAVRTSTEPTAAISAIRNAIHDISASTPVVNVKTMEDLVDESLSPQRFNMILLACFAALALLLAAVGIYSVLAYAVRQRLREIGVRMALGAQIGDVLRMIVADGMKPTMIGVVFGLLASLALSRVLSSLVFGVKATDVPTFLTVTVLLVGTGVIASAMPAYRATRVDPLKTLRDE